MEHFEWSLGDSLKQYQDDPSAIQTTDAPQELIECENDPESFSVGLINEALNPVVDAIAENPEAITRGRSFDTIQYLLK